MNYTLSALYLTFVLMKNDKKLLKILFWAQASLQGIPMIAIKTLFVLSKDQS
jgi:hypothetical protein